MPDIDWKREEKRLAKEASVSIEAVHLVRRSVQKLINTKQEEILAERYGLPVEKVQQIGNLTSELLERMLRELGAGSGQ